MKESREIVIENATLVDRHLDLGGALKGIVLCLNRHDRSLQIGAEGNEGDGDRLF